MIVNSPQEGPVSSRQLAHAQKRRSTRIDQSIPLTVQGADAFRAPYLERVSTLSVNCHGCKYQSKYDVLQGDVVFLEVNRPDENHTTCSCRARVKCVQRLMTKDRPFVVAVELESPGNVWGVSFPPEDWFAAQVPKLEESANGGQERLVVTRPESRAVTIPIETAPRPAQLVSHESGGPLSPMFAQLVAGLGEQIQTMASEAAASAILKEKGQLLDEFRAQLQDEATRTLEQVISASKDELARRALSELSEAHEAAARATHERWVMKIEQELGTAAAGMASQSTELSQRFESMATGTLERLQRTMESARRNGVDHFLARLREQLAPLLEDAQSALQKLVACEHELQETSEVTCKRFETFLQQSAQKSAAEVRGKIPEFEKQLERSVNDKLAKAHEDLDKQSAAVLGESAEALRQLSQSCQQSAQTYFQSLAAPALEQITGVLEERTAEISHRLAAEIEEHTRRYFESISELVAEIPKKTAINSHE
jgi:hypothetical protein